MTLALDLPSCRHSLLGGLDSRWKLAVLALAMAAVCSLRSVSTTGLALAGVLALAGLGKLPLRWLAWRLGLTAVALSPFLLLSPLTIHGSGPGWSWGGIRFSHHGAETAGILLLRSWGLVGLAVVLLATTPMPALLQAARALRVPGLLVQLAMLSYRYVFVLAAEARRLRVAARARGFRNRMSRHGYRTTGHIAASLLVRSQERAGRVSQAMRSRGFDGQFRSLADGHTGRADVFFCLAVLAAAAVLILWDHFPS